MPDLADLLPPNASDLERAASLAMARLADVPTPLGDLWDPATCPASLLPWLAWALSIDRWRPEWSLAQKRIEVARAIQLQRMKGTPAAIDALLESFDPLLEMAEWFEGEAGTVPHTFTITLPVDGSAAARNTAQFAQEVVRDVNRIKPARSHFVYLQSVASADSLRITAAAQMALFQRHPGTLQQAAALDWAGMLATQNGEPLQSPDGSFLEVI